jgi:pimeloyl-ACP methyl ester carboxylesterase
MTETKIYKSVDGEKAVMDLYSQVLDQWPVPNKKINLSTHCGNTFVVKSGKASSPALILLHGAGANSAMWKNDVGKLSQAFQVFTVDIPGEPGRSAPVRLPWETNAFSEWLDDVIDQLGIRKTSIIGLSQGGWVAAKYAAFRPDMVEKLVLMSPAGIVPDKLGFAFAAIPLSLFGAPGIRMINRMLFANQDVPWEIEYATIVTMKNFKTRIGIVPLLSREDLTRLTMPTLLLMGSKECLRDGKKISFQLGKYLPKLTTIIIPNGGHALVDGVDPAISFLEKGANFSGKSSIP